MKIKLEVTAAFFVLDLMESFNMHANCQAASAMHFALVLLNAVEVKDIYIFCYVCYY